MVVDAWGNEYKTKEEARKAFIKMFHESDDFLNDIVEAIDTQEVVEWVVQEMGLKEEFLRRFQKDVKCAEEYWCWKCFYDADEF